MEGRLDVKQVWLKIKGIKVKGPGMGRPRELAPAGSYSQPGLEAGEAPSEGSPEQPRAGEDAGRAVMGHSHSIWQSEGRGPGDTSWGTENGSGDTWKTTASILAGPLHAVVPGMNSLPRTNPKAMSSPGAQQS